MVSAGPGEFGGVAATRLHTNIPSPWIFQPYFLPSTSNLEHEIQHHRLSDHRTTRIHQLNMHSPLDLEQGHNGWKYDAYLNPHLHPTLPLLTSQVPPSPTIR